MWGADSSLLTLAHVLPLPSAELMFTEQQCRKVVKDVGSGGRELALGELVSLS